MSQVSREGVRDNFQQNVMSKDRDINRRSRGRDVKRAVKRKRCHAKEMSAHRGVKIRWHKEGMLRARERERESCQQKDMPRP